MNERIRLLADQARELSTTRHPISNIVLSIPPDLFEQKFAQLIVRECAGVCESMQLIGPYKEVQDATLKDASVYIKEHFGVE